MTMAVRASSSVSTVTPRTLHHSWLCREAAAWLMKMLRRRANRAGEVVGSGTHNMYLVSV